MPRQTYIGRTTRGSLWCALDWRHSTAWNNVSRKRQHTATNQSGTIENLPQRIGTYATKKCGHWPTTITTVAKMEQPNSDSTWLHHINPCYTTYNFQNLLVHEYGSKWYGRTTLKFDDLGGSPGLNFWRPGWFVASDLGCIARIIQETMAVAITFFGILKSYKS